MIDLAFEHILIFVDLEGVIHQFISLLGQEIYFSEESRILDFYLFEISAADSKSLFEIFVTMVLGFEFSVFSGEFFSLSAIVERGGHWMVDPRIGK